MELTSTKNATVLYAASLKDKKYRDKENKYLIEGEHLVNMAGDDIECIFTTDESYKNDKVTVYYVNDAVLKKISFVQSPQGIIGVVRKKEIYVQGLSKVLVLDNLQDPGNVGTLLRSALAFNYNQVFISDNCVDIYNLALLFLHNDSFQLLLLHQLSILFHILYK